VHCKVCIFNVHLHVLARAEVVLRSVVFFTLVYLEFQLLASFVRVRYLYILFYSFLYAYRPLQWSI